jgi:hypothetical protein
LYETEQFETEAAFFLKKNGYEYLIVFVSYRKKKRLFKSYMSIYVVLSIDESLSPKGPFPLYGVGNDVKELLPPGPRYCSEDIVFLLICINNSE